jgi:hypothetical protein
MAQHCLIHVPNIFIACICKYVTDWYLFIYLLIYLFIIYLVICCQSVY